MFTLKPKPGAASLLRTRTRKAKKLILSYGTILFMIFSVFLIASLYLMRQNILSNSNTVGYEVAQRLDASLQVEFQKQKQFVEFIAHYADIFLQDHADDPDGGRAAFDLWMKQTEAELQSKQKDLRIDIYASIDGQIVSPTYWDGDAFLITEARPWYKAAMKAEPGKAAILDPYTDIFTNTVITTVSARIGNTNNVFAIDLYLESASQSSSFAYLVSENYCFYLVDSKGTVILYYTPFNANYSQIQRYVSSFFETNVKNHVPGTEEPITDLMGDKRNVFATYNPETGWYTIATTLYSDILFNYHMISNLFLLMVVIFIIIEVWMVWREYHLSSQIETTNEALKVLGNSYQVILRVNFKMGTFTTLKAPDHMRLRLATRNSFDDLLSVFSDMVIPESWNNFYKNFSLNHLRNLASLSIRDFGHDYQLKLNNDNHYKWFNARILFDESLDLDESIICFKLIDEEKITEIEEHQLLADALEQAKKNEESKNVFFANMSHDMRTPLNGIIGLCQIGINHLKQSDVNSLPDVFKKMTTASHQLLALVDDILEVARPQMESKLTLEPFDIVHAVQENIDVFKVNALSQGKQVNLTCDVKHKVVIGDSAKLRQILNNLVSNSLKYSHRGCVVNISIREILHLHKPSFMIEVSDTGIGMEKNFLAKLFAPYARELRLNSVQGTGLGMSIVKNVVTIMGGDIKVKSAVDVGTTFTINIPFRLADDETTSRIEKDTEKSAMRSDELEARGSRVVEDKTQDSKPAVKSTDSIEDPLVKNFIDNFSLSNLNILIVEDNQLNMEIACDILGMKGVNLTSAWDGVQAVETFTSKPAFTFDAILMDMRMPNMDGCEASSHIRASSNKDAATVPIIACTANAFTEDIAATQNAGMNAHVSKPLDFTVLEHVLAKVISSRPDLKELLQVHASRKDAAPAPAAPAAPAPAAPAAPAPAAPAAPAPAAAAEASAPAEAPAAAPASDASVAAADALSAEQQAALTEQASASPDVPESAETALAAANDDLPASAPADSTDAAPADLAAAPADSTAAVPSAPAATASAAETGSASGLTSNAASNVEFNEIVITSSDMVHEEHSQRSGKNGEPASRYGRLTSEQSVISNMEKPPVVPKTDIKKVEADIPEASSADDSEGLTHEQLREQEKREAQALLAGGASGNDSSASLLPGGPEHSPSQFRPPVAPKHPLKMVTDGRNDLEYDSDTTLALDSGSVNSITAEEESHASYEQEKKVRLSLGPVLKSLSAKASRSSRSVKMHTNIENRSLDYSHLGESTHYTSIKRRSGDRLDIRSQLNRSDAKSQGSITDTDNK